MQLLRFQTAVFFKTSAERPDLLAGNMTPELLTLFDQIPITNPVPQFHKEFLMFQSFLLLHYCHHILVIRGQFLKAEQICFIIIQQNETILNYCRKYPSTRDLLLNIFAQSSR